MENAGSVLGMSQEDFMAHIIAEICDYSVVNNMEPDETILTIADNLKVLLDISTFNNWVRRV